MYDYGIGYDEYEEKLEKEEWIDPITASLDKYCELKKIEEELRKKKEVKKVEEIKETKTIKLRRK